ncbi:PAS domain-containing protein [bacterium]|nr:PAS domain-containing protein [bacterium]
MNEKDKMTVYVWEHSPEIAGEISKIVFDLGHPISDSFDASVIIVGPSISADELRNRFPILKSKKVILVVNDNAENIIEKARTIFGIVKISEINNLGDAFNLLERTGNDFEIDSSELIVKLFKMLGFESGDLSEILWQRIYTILDTIPLGLIIIHRGDGVVSANNRAQQILQTDKKLIGLSKEQFCEKFNICPGGKDFLESLENIDRPLTFSHRFPDDRVVDVALTSIPNSNEFLITLEDVSEFNREREWLKGILGTFNDGVLVLDRDRRLVWSNDVIKDWFGNKFEQGPVHCYDFWGDRKNICSHCPLNSVFDKKETCRYTERFVQDNNEERFYDIIAAPIQSADGSVYRIVQLARDVTEQELMIQELMSTRRSFETANLQLKKQYMTLRTITEISDTLQRTSRLDKILHIILTAVTAKEGLGFNRAFFLLVNETTGILEGKYAIGPSSPEEAGRIWSELSDVSQTLAETLQNYEKATQNEDTVVKKIIGSFRIPLDSDHFLIKILNDGNTLLVNPQNKELWEQTKDIRERLNHDTFAVVPLVSMEKSVGILIVDNMITHRQITSDDLELLRSLANHASFAIERSSLTEKLRSSHKKLETAYDSLRENQEKLVEAEKLSTIGEMAAQVAHEIKNPLVSIGGFARRLLKQIPDDNEKHKAAEVILEESNRLEKIIGDVLGYAKLSTKQVELGNINQSLYDTLVLFEPEFEEKKIKINVGTSEEIPPFMFDPNQIRQVFINLIRNSLSVLKSDGIISIKTKKDKNYCWIEFSDNGPGVPKGIGDMVFKPFFTTRTTGTGLGLSISARIIKSHNGTIWYKNNPAGGVTFFIRLLMKTET